MFHVFCICGYAILGLSNTNCVVQSLLRCLQYSYSFPVGRTRSLCQKPRPSSTSSKKLGIFSCQTSQSSVPDSS